MAKLIFPRRNRGQPNQPVSLNPCHPIFPYLVFAWSAGRTAYQDAKHAYQAFSQGTPINTNLLKTGKFGRSVAGTSTASCINWSNIPDHIVLGDVTCIARIRTYSSFSAVAIMVSKASSNGTIHTPYQFLTGTNGAGSTGYIGIGRAGATAYRNWGSGVEMLLPLQDYVVAATHSGPIENPPVFYVNGVRDTSTPFSVGGGTGLPTGPSPNMRMIGNGVNWGCLHDVYDVAVCNAVLPESLIKQVSWNLDSIWTAPPRRFEVDTTVVPSSLSAFRTTLSPVGSRSGSRQVHP